jgi:hypothetical protein
MLRGLGMMGESKGVVDWGVVADCLTRVVLSQNVDQFGDRRQSSKNKCVSHLYPWTEECFGRESCEVEERLRKLQQLDPVAHGLSNPLPAPSPRIRDEKHRKHRTMHLDFQHPALLLELVQLLRFRHHCTCTAILVVPNFKGVPSLWPR